MTVLVKLDFMMTVMPFVKAVTQLVILVPTVLAVLPVNPPKEELKMPKVLVFVQ